MFINFNADKICTIYDCHDTQFQHGMYFIVKFMLLGLYKLYEYKIQLIIMYYDISIAFISFKKS